MLIDFNKVDPKVYTNILKSTVGRYKRNIQVKTTRWLRNYFKSFFVY